jgi:hypothetical protein
MAAPRTVFSLRAGAIIEHGQKGPGSGRATGAEKGTLGNASPVVGSSQMGAPHLPILTGLIVADTASTLEVVAVVILFTAALAVLIAAIIWVRNWRLAVREEKQSTTKEPIETYQHMLDEGLIDQQEFDRIQAGLRRSPLPFTPDSAPLTENGKPEPPSPASPP